MPTLPAASVVVTLASIVVSASAAKSLPGTLMLKLPPASTTPVWSTPLTVKVTVSPVVNSPATTPVTATVPPASAALITSSAVMLASKVIVGTGSTPSCSMARVACGAGLPPKSLTSAVTVSLAPSACASIAGIFNVQALAVTVAL